MTEATIAVGSVMVALAGLSISTYLFDRGVSNYLSRKYGHVFGGFAYLIGVLWLECPVAFGLAVAFLVLFLGLRVFNDRLLRGVGGSARRHAYAEVTYAFAGAVSLGIGWGVMGDKWLAFVPIGFMAFGDSITGMVRSVVIKREAKHWSGSVAMLAVCLGLAGLYQPYWVGASGAVAATVAEKLSPIARGWLDDNWILTGTSLGAMALLRSI